VSRITIMQIVIAGGGPAGAMCARALAKAGVRTVLIEASMHGRKPCAGGLPSILLERYSIPELLIKQKNTGVIFHAPSGLEIPVDFPDGMCIATVDRQEFDTHLRWAAEDAGARIFPGRVIGYEDRSTQLMVQYRDDDGTVRTTEADFLVGADGATSRVAQQAMGSQLKSVIAIQEEIELSKEAIELLGKRCIFNYSPAVSPDYYGWVFPKGATASIGIGTRLENRDRITSLLDRMKEIHADVLKGGKILRRNGGLIPVGGYKEHGSRRVLLAGDAAGFVLPACGEGIYFAMRSGEMAAAAIVQYGRERPDILVSKYTDAVNNEFRSIFQYFEKIERLTYKSVETREMFVRLAQDDFMGKKILKAFAGKERVHTPPFKKMQVMFNLMSIRSKVAKEIAKNPDFGK
jgi:geranylgeranyl diphosphate/geranylgeranyl-bacteriochlorophyllide a reductase